VGLVGVPASGQGSFSTAGGLRSSRSGLLSGSPTSGLFGASSAPLIGKPAYYQPVIVAGKAFPVLRSNYLSYISFTNDWHAPRLRFMDGTWQLVGVHEGNDILSERGTPIVSMTPGIVEATGWTFYSGTRVGVRGTDGRYYFYAHFSAIAPSIRPGVRVEAGTELGLVGNTGYGPPGHRDEFPPHLHFGIQVGSEWVTPYPTLVSLYAATVAAQERGQRSLDALARAGDRAAWERAAAGLYMGPLPGLGE
jgi:murein DD-endopeptidase MepM/ murein hydrolase activator NlpD